MPRPSNVEPKFDECLSCKHFGRIRPCVGCDVGENFEEIEAAGVDEFMRHNIEGGHRD